MVVKRAREQSGGLEKGIKPDRVRRREGERERGEIWWGLSPQRACEPREGKRKECWLCVYIIAFPVREGVVDLARTLDGEREERKEDGPRNALPFRPGPRANFEGTGDLFRRRRRLAEKNRLESCKGRQSKEERERARATERGEGNEAFSPLFFVPLASFSSSPFSYCSSFLFALICFGTCHCVTCKMSFQISQGSTKIAQPLPFFAFSFPVSAFTLSSFTIRCTYT